MESNIVRIRTLGIWPVGIMRPVMEVFLEAYALFVLVIIAPSFTVLNLLIAIIVDSSLTPYQKEATPQPMMSPKQCITTAARCRLKLSTYATRSTISVAPLNTIGFIDGTG